MARLCCGIADGGAEVSTRNRQPVVSATAAERRIDIRPVAVGPSLVHALLHGTDYRHRETTFVRGN